MGLGLGGTGSPPPTFFFARGHRIISLGGGPLVKTIFLITKNNGPPHKSFLTGFNNKVFFKNPQKRRVGPKNLWPKTRQKEGVLGVDLKQKKFSVFSLLREMVFFFFSFYKMATNISFFCPWQIGKRGPYFFFSPKPPPLGEKGLPLGLFRAFFFPRKGIFFFALEFSLRVKNS